MLRTALFILGMFTIISCENRKAEDRESTPGINEKADSTNAITPVAGCYIRIIQRDTLAASLQQDGNSITGKLTFDNYQKDGSSGTVAGRIENGIVKLTYRFSSEGMQSVSEAYFKLTPTGLVHGYGDVKVKGDSAYYSDPANITYTDTLLKVHCNELAAKYQ